MSIRRESAQEICWSAEALARRRSLRRILPRQRQAITFTARFATSSTSLRQRPNHANVLATTQRQGHEAQAVAAANILWTA